MCFTPLSNVNFLLLFVFYGFVIPFIITFRFDEMYPETFSVEKHVKFFLLIINSSVSWDLWVHGFIPYYINVMF